MLDMRIPNPTEAADPHAPANAWITSPTADPMAARVFQALMSPAADADDDEDDQKA